jgi:hypothetical protein
MLGNPLQERNDLARFTTVPAVLRRVALPIATVGAVAALSACDLPFGLGTPSTRALESGASATLAPAQSFEITGSYTESAQSWSIDLQIGQPGTEHVALSSADLKVEAILLPKDAYFRGQKFLSDHMAKDPLSQNLVKAAGNAWWKGAAGLAPQMPDLTDGAVFKTTFLGSVVTHRTDHVTVDGIDAVEMSSARADVYIASLSPYHVLRVAMKKGVVIDGIADGDFRYTNFNQDFAIAAPTDVIDFSNLSTLPPIYTVVSVDASGCASPCMVSALLKNLGGLTGAKAPSAVTFKMTATASAAVLGTCQVQVIPDVGFNATTIVRCTINLTGQLGNAALVTATADNPGRA